MSENVKVDMACNYCGSRDVYRDAVAAWNAMSQCWELGAVMDQGYCKDCCGESTLSEVVLMKPFYVERMVGGVMQDLRVADWYWQAWNGCFCRIEDRSQWCDK